MTKRISRKGPPKLKRHEWSLTGGGHLQEVKNNEKSLTVRPKKWSQSLTGGGRLLEVPPVRL